MRGFRHADGTLPPGGAAVDPAVLVRGPVTTDDIARGPALVSAAIAGRPITALRLNMARYGGAGGLHAVAQINVEIAGRLVRAQATGASVRAAVERVAAALPDRLRRLERRLTSAMPCRPSFAGECWERRGCRVISPAVRRSDGVLHRPAPGYRLALREPAARVTMTAAPVAEDADVPPIQTLPEAVRRLDETVSPFVVFLGLAGGRIEVLYRRYDGHLGLVTPLW